MKKVLWMVLAVLILLLMVFLWYIGAKYFISDFGEKIKLTGDIEPYVRAEVETSTLPSRQWMAYVIRIAKERKLSLIDIAQLYAYVASIYADVLKSTDDSSQASLSTAQLINSFFPDQKQETDMMLVSFQIKNNNLSASSKNILTNYIKRSKEDNDTSKTWVIDKDNFLIPSPPRLGSIIDWLELKKVQYATTNRTANDEEIIFFWDGIDSFYSIRRPSITPAGVWQNILFIETNNSSTDKDYAEHQKILAQVIADALILTWKGKYMYALEYPSMRIPNLPILFPNPGYPSYPSEYAATSFAAEIILDALIPGKKTDWKLHANNATYSRLLSGINSEADIVAGKQLGINVGNAMLKKYYPQSKLLGPVPKLCNWSICHAEALAFFAALEIKELFTEKLNPLKQVLPTLEDVAEVAGFTDLSIPAHQYDGVSWVDYDGDGNLDILVTNLLYHNMGNGKFAFKQGFPDWGVFGDYNNDGCPDLYIVRTSESKHNKPRSNDPTMLSDLLFKNNCDGSFTDVSKSANIKDTYHGRSATWIDYNNDGYLDIYVASWGITEAERWYYESKNPKQEYVFEPNMLYRNNGNGTFTDVTSQAGVEGTLECNDPAKRRLAIDKKLKPSFQPMWFDYNNDGLLDLLVVTDALISPMYKNNGNGTFTQVTESAGLCTTSNWTNMGASIGDFNSDGFLDFYVTNAGENFLWQNNGNGTFTNVANQVGAQDLGYGWGTETLDYDNDGYMDIVVINGNSRLRAPPYSVPSGLKRNDLDELFKNNGAGMFRAVGRDEGFSIRNEIKYAVAVADYNNDGAVDIFVPMSPWRHSTSIPSLFRNRGNNNHWITIQLIGTKSNRDGIGARIEVRIGGRKQIKDVQAGASYRSQSSPWLTFGLGKHKTIEKLVIRWPSGITQTISNIPINQKIIIKEGDQTIY